MSRPADSMVVGLGAMRLPIARNLVAADDPQIFAVLDSPS